jgi:hypothetical protein
VIENINRKSRGNSKSFENHGMQIFFVLKKVKSEKFELGGDPIELEHATYVVNFLFDH